MNAASTPYWKTDTAQLVTSVQHQTTRIILPVARNPKLNKAATSNAGGSMKFSSDCTAATRLLKECTDGREAGASVRRTSTAQRARYRHRTPPIASAAHRRGRSQAFQNSCEEGSRLMAFVA